MDIFKEIAKGLIGQIVVLDEAEITEESLRALTDMGTVIIVDNVTKKESQKGN